MRIEKKWESIDMDLMKELALLHNEITLKIKEENEFDLFVIKNKEKLINPTYLGIFAERVEISEEYFKRHYEICKFFFDLMENNPGWNDLQFGFRQYLRLGVFQDNFKKYLHIKRNRKGR